MPRGLLALVLLWCASLALGPSALALLLQTTGWVLNPHGHVHLYAHGHPFVDARSWLGLPNAMDVVSNLAFVLAGAWGWWLLGHRQVAAQSRPALAVFFTGLLLCGAGSAWYHWAPDVAGLAVDRLGMAVAFAGALAWVMHERGLPGVGLALPLLLLMGCISALLPWLHNQVLPWAVFQFGGMTWVLLMALRRAPAHALGVSVGAVIAWYALAKWLELNDGTIFEATGQWVSGHSLKHLAAACAAWPVLHLLQGQALRHNADKSKTFVF